MSCRVHPQIIVSGWRKAVQVAQQALEAAAVDHSSDEEKFKEDLLNIARTTLSSKILMQHRDHFANLAVKAVLRLKVNSARILLCRIWELILFQEHNVRIIFVHKTFLVQGSGNLDAIQIIKKLGGNLVDSYLDEGNHCRPKLNSKFYCFKYM